MPRYLSAVDLAAYLSTLLVDIGGPNDEPIVTRLTGDLDELNARPVLEVSIGAGATAPRFALTIEAVDR
jgi:hypothetical protein